MQISLSNSILLLIQVHESFQLATMQAWDGPTRYLSNKLIHYLQSTFNVAICTHT